MPASRLALTLAVAIAALASSPADAAPRGAKSAPTGGAGTPAPKAAEPTPTEPTPTEPTPTEPTPAEPTPTEPTPTEPTPTEPTPTEPAPTEPTPVDRAALASIQAEARALQDDIFKARARVSTVTSKLFRSRLAVQMRSNLERFYEVGDLVISLDGAPVFTQAAGIPSSAGDLLQAYAAPGAHELTISARLVARRDATYKLRIDDTYTIYVPDDSTVTARVTLRETGNMWNFTKRGRGHHNVATMLRAKAKPNTRGRAAKKVAP